MINFVIWLIVGGLIGWLASVLMGTNSRQGLIADIAVGILGSFIGGFILSPLFNIGTINEHNYSIPSLLVSLGGAIILLLIFKLFRIIGGLVLIIIIALLVYAYVSCGPASTSAICTAAMRIPFFQ